MASIIDIIELDNGDQFAVTIEWSPDPKAIEEVFLKAANDFEDWTIPLEQARELMIESTREHFANETDPFGVPWAPLSEKYLAQKQRMGAPEDNILVLTGDMREAATSEENWIMAKNSVFFNTASLPKYAPVHQEGTQSAGAAKVFEASRRGAPLSAKEAQGLLADVKDGSGNNTPKRAFLGIDYAHFDAIEEVFIAHMDRTVTDYVQWVAPVPGDIVTTTAGATGRLTSIQTARGGFMVRGVGGRFVKGTFHLP